MIVSLAGCGGLGLVQAGVRVGGGIGDDPRERGTRIDLGRSRDKRDLAIDVLVVEVRAGRAEREDQPVGNLVVEVRAERIAAGDLRIVAERELGDEGTAGGIAEIVIGRAIFLLRINDVRADVELHAEAAAEGFAVTQFEAGKRLEVVAIVRPGRLVQEERIGVRGDA